VTEAAGAWARADRARDELAALVLGRPHVSMVDIGLDEDGESPLLRVHVRDESAELAELPTEIDGIRVRVVAGDYRPERPAM
jgi:hypothetical protein